MAFALWWISVIILIIGFIFLIMGATKIAGITIRIATWIMILAIIIAVIILLFGLV